MRIDSRKLRIKLMDREMTQVQLSKETGLSRVVVNNICRGVACKPETAEKIATALNMPLESLLEDKAQ